MNTTTRKRRLAWFGVCLLLPVFAHADDVEEKYDSGEVKFSYSVDDEGRKHGRYYEKYKSGKNKVRANYKDGMLNGSYYTFHENGRRHIKAKYDDGKLEGDYYEKDENGKYVLKCEYENGLLHGPYQKYEDGELVQTLLYRRGIVSHPRNKKQIEAELKRLAEFEPPEMEKEPEVYNEQCLGALRRLMQYRYLCEVPYENVRLDKKLNEHAHEGARLVAAHGSLNHHPPNPGWPEDKFEFARVGTEKANLSWNSAYSGSVDGYMYDSDQSNISRVGHRRWCINPAMGKTGFGAVKNDRGEFGSMMAHDTSNKGNVPAWDWVVFPARGYMPLSHMCYRFASKKGLYAFNITLNPAVYEKVSKNSVTVDVYDLKAEDGKKRRRRRGKDEEEEKDPHAEGKKLELDYFNVDHGGFGVGNCIIFRPKGYELKADALYKVVIKGAKKKGQESEPVVYYVEFY